jgi:zinc protease
MFRTFVVLFCLSIIGGTAAMAEKIFPYPSRTEVLPNGLTVILVPMASPGLVSYYSVVRTGSRDEVEPGKSGFAHFFEHMMFRGTKKYPGSVYDHLITGMGASANASTSDDQTVYHLSIAKEDLERVMELESDRFQNLSYEEREFKTEAGAIYGEYRKSVTSPFALLSEKMQDLAFTTHTYKHTTIGFEADIKAMPEAYAYSSSFFKRFYRPENVVVLVTGDIDPDAVLGLIRKYYGDWQRGYVAPQITPEPPQTAERTAEITFPGKTLPILNIGYKGTAFDPNDRMFAAAVLLGDLAFGETSDLYKKLYIREQRVQMLGAGIPMNRDMPLFEVTAMVKKDADISAVRDEIYATIAAFQSGPADAKRLEGLKNRRRYAFLMGLDSPEAVAGRLSMFVSLTGTIASVDVYYAQLAAVTPADIQRAAQLFFTPERRTAIVLKGGRS